MVRFTLFGGADTARVAEADSVAVIGLGRFGRALALELMASGTEVLGIDRDEDIVQSLNGQLTHVVRADSTREEVLKQLSIPEFDRVVVAIGTDVEASILTTSLLLSYDIPEIWAKAVSDAHGTILSQIGIKHVIYPEQEMGRRVAHLVRGAMKDYIEIGDDFAMVKTTPNATLIGKTLAETGLLARYGVTVAAIKRPGERWDYPTADTVINADDEILVTGQTGKAEAFSQLR